MLIFVKYRDFEIALNLWIKLGKIKILIILSLPIMNTKYLSIYYQIVFDFFSHHSFVVFYIQVLYIFC